MSRSMLLAAIAASVLAFGATGASANSDNGNKNGFVTTSTQGGSTNTCNGNPGCTDTLENKAGNNKTCTGPDSQCSK